MIKQLNLLLIGVMLCVSHQINAETTTLIPAPPILPGAVQGAPNLGNLLNSLQLAAGVYLTTKCNETINKNTDDQISTARSKIKKLTKFILVVDYENCSASVKDYVKGPYLIEGGAVTPIELFPVENKNLVNDIYFIFPKIDDKISNSYFKLTGATDEMWKASKKHKLIEKRVMSEYQTKKYSVQKLRKGRCGYLYSKQTKSGKLKMYFANTYKSLAEAQGKSEEKAEYGYKILEVLCNS